MPTINPPRILDKSGKLIAILQNAYAIGYSKQKNALWTCSFSLPLDDAKATHVQPKYFVDLYDHDRYIGKFVVNPKRTFKTESTNEITYHCEHVLSLLHSDVLFGYHQYTNYTTQTVLSGLMDAQETKHWRLGDVAITRYFHYSWENEDSLLNAIMSVPGPFDEPYLWTWDDTVYPFVLDLVKPSDAVKGMVIAGKNLRGLDIDEDPTNIVTRIYPLGFGEGVNQLTIAKVNGGRVYLQDDAAVAQYGVHKRVWVDLRFEVAESLKASAQAILDKFKAPIKTVSIDCIDYSLIDPYELSQYEVGDVLRVHDRDTGTDENIRVERMEKADLYGAPYDLQLELGNVRDDISTTFADLQKKQLVNDTYSQGATNIDSRDFADNCDANFPAVIRFPIPDDVVNINEMTLTFETTNYRAYSKAIEGGGAIVSSTAAGGATTRTSSAGGATTRTSSSGGGTTATSTSGGGVAKSTASGGGSSQTSSGGGSSSPTSSANGSHRHVMFQTTGSDPWDGDYRVAASTANGASIWLAGGTPTMTNFSTLEASDNHSHSVSVPSHTHSVTIPSHTHNFDVPNHAHNVTIPNHTHDTVIPAHTHDTVIPDHKHDITLPDHVHEIKHGIFEYGTLPTAIQITVDGKVLPLTATYGDSIDLLPYLQTDSGGRIVRGRYAEIKLAPNNLARINATVSSRLFIQSRIGTVV